MTETTSTAGLYRARVMHQRLRPVRHRLYYNVYYLLLDIDQAELHMRPLRLLSWRRFNLMSFDDRDHGGGGSLPLRAWVELHLAIAGIELQGGAIRLLTMPRVLGYCFNPISLYYCHHRDGSLRAMVYEVRNTFGERHSYLIPVANEGPGKIVNQHCAKIFHVSPFLGMDMRYAFRTQVPDDKLSLAIDVLDAQGPILNTMVSGRHQLLNDRAIFTAFVATPLLTLKVICGIHWEALKLWMKNLRFHPRPGAPASPVTIVKPLLTEGK